MTYRVWVRVFNEHGKTLDETLIQDEDYGMAMRQLMEWSNDSFAEKDL